MPCEILFTIHLILGYVACLLWFGAYIYPRLKSMPRFDSQRIIATIHSFRFFGLVFILPGVIGPNLPSAFGAFAAWGDFATGILALLALLTSKIRPLFWTFVAAFNIVGIVDLLGDYFNAIRLNVPAIAGQFGATYAIPVVYVPMLMITHIVALYWLLRPEAGSPQTAALAR